MGQSLSRSYGRYFAEFLNASCPDHLGLLDHPTGVGLRYDLMCLSERRFSWKLKQSDSAARVRVIGWRSSRTGDLPPALNVSRFPRPVNADVLVFRLRHASLRSESSFQTDILPLAREQRPARLSNSSLGRYTRGAGIFTCCPSATLFSLTLGPTNPTPIDVAWETLGIRRAGFSPALWLLIPTVSLLSAPQHLTVLLHC